MSTHDDRVTRQFSKGAQRYLGSKVHSEGGGLDWLSGIVELHKFKKVLDLGTGAGHAAYRVAPHVASVTALDPSLDMLSVVDRESRFRGIANIETRVGDSNAIPFEDRSFCCIVSRFSAHHWRDLQGSLKECFRVLKPGGRFLLVDTAAPREALLDTWFQAFEILHDTTHVRNHSLTEWERSLGCAGFDVISYRNEKIVLPVQMWLQTSATTEDRSVMIRKLFDLAPDEVREYYLENGGNDLVIDIVMIEGVLYPKQDELIIHREGQWG